MKHQIFLFLQIFCLILPLTIIKAVAKTERTLQCKVIGISDGDTLTCLKDCKAIKVRLLNIDAPESGQAFGKNAKQFLSSLVFKKYVTLKSTGYDQYHRLLATVYSGNTNVNLKMVQQGLAWAYHYQTQEIYQQAQQTAKKQQIGLWKEKNPLDPYEWRKRSDSYQNLQKKSNKSPLVKGDMDCSKHLSCNKIGSYDLAVKYFKQCAWGKFLDGNRDGIPCNKLYRNSKK